MYPALGGVMEDRTTQIRVLAIDDEEGASLIDSILSSEGCQVISAHDDEDPIIAAAQVQPDIILLDVESLGLSGYATARALSEREATSSIPVVILTSAANREQRMRALKAGAVDLLVKPLDPAELRAKVVLLARLKGYNNEMKRRRAEQGGGLPGSGSELQAALDAFARFVPQEFLSALNKSSIVEVRLGDHVKIDVAILFSDIRRFTAMSEKMTPEQSFSFLNSYLSRMNPFIWENGGFIDKYMGDGIMALFPKGAGSAISAAVAMLSYLPSYNKQRAGFGYEPIGVGIGVHSGPAMLGVIGHERFMQGTAISDSVNLASRLQDLTKFYDVSLIVSSHALFDLENPNRFDYRFLDKVQLRGKEKVVSVYEVFTGDPPNVRNAKSSSREEFEKGVYDYHGGRFHEALAHFDAIRATGADRPLEIYRRRCARAIKLGAAEEGDGS
jgi:two-component system sensor histidine kinase ChiS